MVLAEVANAILDIGPKQSGYIVGAIVYEVVETLILIELEDVLGNLPSGSSEKGSPLRSVACNSLSC